MKKSEDQNSLRTVLRRTAAASPGLCVLLAVCAALAVVLSLLPPLVLERAVNLLGAKKPVALRLALLYFGLVAVGGLFESGRNVLITVFGQRITHGLRSALAEKLGRLPAAFFSKNEPGAVASRFVNDVDAVDSLFTDGILSMAADAFKLVGVLAVIFVKSTGLGLVMLAVTPLLFWLTRVFQRRMLAAQLDNRAAIARVNAQLPETVHCIRMLHTLSREEYMEARYDRHIAASYRATDRSNRYDSLYSPIVVFTGACVVALMMVCAASGGTLQRLFGVGVGTAVAMIAYVGKIFEPIESIGMEIQNIQSAVAGVRRIAELLRQPERRVLPQPAGPAPARAPAVELRDVHFDYGDGAEVLHGLSFAVQSGETVTLTGRTGAGKSTVFRLIEGLYPPTRGQVLVYGVPAEAVPDAQKRKLFGYVEQSVHLVQGTAAEQISLFDPAIGPEQVERAARLVGLHDVLAGLPQGYDTPAEKLSLSQGQLQLLAIARAVAASPRLLLLDEITADLDAETEARVLAALGRAAGGRTVLSISHRLGAISQGGRLLSIGG